MSKSFSFDTLDNEMMFFEERGSTTSNRRQKMKRMEELSHSLDNGINYIQDDDYYDDGKGDGGGGSRSANRKSGRPQTVYNDEEEDDDYNDDEEDDDFVEDYYYNNKNFDGRPKSFNEKYSYMYDYDTGRGKNDYYRYSLNDPPVKSQSHSKYNHSQQQPQQFSNKKQQQQIQQQQQSSTLRRSYDNMPQYKSSGGSSGGNGNPKHILFNDEDDVHYVPDKKYKEQQSKTSKTKRVEPPLKKPEPKKPEPKKEKEPSSPSLFSSKKKSPKEKEDPSKNDKNSQQVIKARLKLQNVSSDDSVLQMRNNQKTPLMQRHHSIESKSPAHPSEHKLSPTILEEIEYETQDEDAEQKSRDQTPPPAKQEKPVKEKESKSKEKTSSKEKKEKDKEKDNSTPSTPTTKKSFRHHLTNHKKLFKVPDIDLNNLRLSSLFSSTKHMAFGHFKQPAITAGNPSNTTDTNNNKSNSNPPSPTASTSASTSGVLKSKSSDNILSKNKPEIKNVKSVEKFEKIQRIPQQKEKSNNSRNSVNIQSSSENFVEDTSVHSNSVSDVEFESQAMRVVRTVGQAFEVCHKISVQKKNQDGNDDNSEIISDLDHSDIQNLSDFDEPKKSLDTTPILQQDSPVKRPNHLDNLSSHSPTSNLLPSTPTSPTSPTSPTKTSMVGEDSCKENPRELQQLREQLQQQTLQTKQALAQLLLVREQLLSEQNARMEAQQRTQQLLQQNRELLEHIASLSGLNDAERPGLTPANIGIAPQSQLPLYLQSLGLLGAAGHGNMMASSIMNKPNENHVDDMNNNANMKSNSSINNGMQFSSFNNLSGSGNLALQQQLANISLDNLHMFQNKMQSFSPYGKQQAPPQPQHQHQQQPDVNLLAQQELYHLNQELLNRLKNMNIGYSTTPTSLGNNFSAASNNFGSDPSNYIFTNANAQHFLNSSTNNNNSSTNHNNSNSNSNNKNSSISHNDMMSGIPGINNMPSSPLGTLNRSSSTYSTISPLDDNLCLSFDRSLDNINNNQKDDSQFIKPLSQVGALTTLDADGKVKVIVPVSSEKCKSDNFFFGDGGGASGSSGINKSPQSQSKAITPILNRGEKKVTLPGVVTVKVTDEQGNVTNQRKLPAQPSFITRSTSEKVPNRSQMMSQVQRTQWARHTTK